MVAVPQAECLKPPSIHHSARQDVSVVNWFRTLCPRSKPHHSALVPVLFETGRRLHTIFGNQYPSCPSSVVLALSASASSLLDPASLIPHHASLQCRFPV